MGSSKEPMSLHDRYRADNESECQKMIQSRTQTPD